ncbi:MAG TPA: HEAT repeat domain-containing protein [Gemmatimonadales bacterium]
MTIVMPQAAVEPLPESAARDLLTGVVRMPAEQRDAALVPLLRHPSRGVREPALRIGATVLSDDCLTAFLRDGDDDLLRNAGLEMLKMRGNGATTLAIDLLRDRDSDVVLQAVLLLDHVRDPRALAPLRATLRHPNENIVQAAITAIGRLGHRSSVHDLLPFLDGDLWVRMAAIEALGDVRAPEAVAALGSQLDDPMVGSLAAEALSRIGAPEAVRLLARQWLATTGTAEPLLELLAHALEGAREVPAPVPGLLEALAVTLRHGEPTARPAAARCALALGPGPLDGEALDELAKGGLELGPVPACLAHRSDLIGPLLRRVGTLRAWGFRLGALHPAGVDVDALCAAMSDTSRYDQVDGLAECVFANDDSRVGEALPALYRRLPRDVRMGWGAILLRHADAIRRVLDAEGPNRDPVTAILRSVTEASAAAAAAHIVALPDDERLEALGHASGRTDVIVRLPWFDWLRAAPETFGAYAVNVAHEAGLARALPRLRQLLWDRPGRDLIRLVGVLGDEGSVPALRAVLERDDEGLLTLAVTALGMIGGAEARAVLRAVATSSSPAARFAYRALVDCGGARDLEVFRAGVTHADWYIRLASVTALGAAKQPEDVATLALLTADSVPAVADRARAVLGR